MLLVHYLLDLDSPPTDCGAVGSWAGISLNFTVTSDGTQYDRLGKDDEITRTYYRNIC